MPSLREIGTSNGLKLDRIIVCWDGSRAATRTITGAMPFLQKAKQIDIVMVSGKPEEGDEIAGADLGQHLARHGLKVDVKRLISPDIDVASTALISLIHRLVAALAG